MTGGELVLLIIRNGAVRSASSVRATSASAAAAPAAASTASARLFVLATNCPELAVVEVPKEILEVAEETVSSDDAPGNERSSLLGLIHIILFLDRRSCAL